MNIATKYGLGDEVWLIRRDKPKTWIRCTFCDGYETPQANLAPNTTITGGDGSTKTCPECHGSGGRYIYLELEWCVTRKLTLGQVMIRKSSDYLDEEYMAHETGVGSGSVYQVANLYPTKKEAQAECDRRNKESHANP